MDNYEIFKEIVFWIMSFIFVWILIYFYKNSAKTDKGKEVRGFFDMLLGGVLGAYIAIYYTEVIKTKKIFTDYIALKYLIPALILGFFIFMLTHRIIEKKKIIL